jgi:galactokinase/mevalonate kinase-like predicted kinase
MSRRVHRPNLDTLLTQAEKAGRSVKRVVFAPDGGFTLVFAEAESATASDSANEVERWFANNAG